MVVNYPRSVWKNSYAEHEVTGKTYNLKTKIKTLNQRTWKQQDLLVFAEEAVGDHGPNKGHEVTGHVKAMVDGRGRVGLETQCSLQEENQNG